MLKVEKSQGEVYRLKARLENAQTEQESLREEYDRAQASVARLHSERDKAIGELEKSQEELERTQATLGKAQLQQDKLQNLLDKTQSEVDKLQEKLDKTQTEVRRVSTFEKRYQISICTRGFAKILRRTKFSIVHLSSLRATYFENHTIFIDFVIFSSFFLSFTLTKFYQFIFRFKLTFEARIHEVPRVLFV